MRWRRTCLMGCLLLIALLAGGLWYANAVWLPTQGRAWFCRLLAERLNADVTLEALGVHPLEGIVLHDLRITHPATRRLIGQITYARGIAVPALPLQDRSLHVRAYAQVAHPGPVVLLASGRYGLRDGRLSLEIAPRPILLEQLGTATRQRLPPALRSATAIIRATLEQEPLQPLQLSGTCELRQAVVEHPPYRARGTVRIDGTAQQANGGWHWQLTAHPNNVVIEGARGLPPVTNVSGSLQLQDLNVTSLNLTGKVGEVTLGLTGEIADIRRPRLHLTALAQGPASALPTFVAPWPTDVQLTGQVRVSVELRGDPQQITPSTLRGEMELRDVGVQPPALWPAIQRLNGRLAYDQGTLSAAGLRFVAHDVPYTLSGTVRHLTMEDEPAMTLCLASEALTANVEAQLEEQTLRLRVFEGRYHGSTFRVMGDLLNLPRPTANLYAESTVDAADLPQWPLPDEWRALASAHPATGTVRLNASFQGPLDAAWSTAGRLGLKVAAQRFSMDGLTLQEARVEARVEEGRLDVPAFSALYAGGQVQGRGSADLRQPQPPFQVQLTAAQVDLEQATRPWRAANVPMAGTLNTSWTLQGQGAQWRMLRGTGTVQAVGENLGTVPVLDRILGGLGGMVADHLRLGRLRQVTFKQVEGSVGIADGQALTRDLVIRGDTMGVLVEGAIGIPDGGLDLVATPSVAQAVVQESPAAEAAAAPAKSFDALTLGRVRITGTLREPQFKSQLLPAGDLLQRVLPSGVQDLLQGVQDMLRR